MDKKKIGLVILAVLVLLGGTFYYVNKKSSKNVKQIQLGATDSTAPANQGNVSPISGIACDNWNKRPVAFMQPADVAARPLAGLSQADMVFEMAAVYGDITRLMGVYQCNQPEEIGSLRSARHDFVHIAKSLGAIYVHWGRSDIEEFKNLLNGGIIDDMNCNDDGGKSAGKYCFRKEANGTMRGVDTGYAKFATILEGAKAFGYKLDNTFVGYPHQAEAALDQRPTGGHLRVGFAKPYAAEYDYDKATNSYLRTWGNVADTDRNNKQRIAPKNVVVVVADAAPLVAGEQYVNIQIGDPWYDTADSGTAMFYMNGQEIKGTWKKDKSKAGSKLFFYDGNGQEIKFVPGQIWVDQVDPGQNVRWTPGA
jgi:hypothetical protein